MKYSSVRACGLESFVDQVNRVEQERKYSMVWESFRIRDCGIEDVYTVMLQELEPVYHKKAGFGKGRESTR